jgi:hypothetical protein
MRSQEAIPATVFFGNEAVSSNLNSRLFLLSTMVSGMCAVSDVIVDFFCVRDCSCGFSRSRIFREWSESGTAESPTRLKRGTPEKIGGYDILS